MSVDGDVVAIWLLQHVVLNLNDGRKSVQPRLSFEAQWTLFTRLGSLTKKLRSFYERHLREFESRHVKVVRSDFYWPGHARSKVCGDARFMGEIQESSEVPWPKRNNRSFHRFPLGWCKRITFDSMYKRVTCTLTRYPAYTIYEHSANDLQTGRTVDIALIETKDEMAAFSVDNWIWLYSLNAYLRNVIEDFRPLMAAKYPFFRGDGNLHLSKSPELRAIAKMHGFADPLIGK